MKPIPLQYAIVGACYFRGNETQNLPRIYMEVVCGSCMLKVVDQSCDYRSKDLQICQPQLK